MARTKASAKEGAKPKAKPKLKAKRTPKAAENTPAKAERTYHQQLAWTLSHSGLNQHEIAERIGVDQSTVSRWLGEIHAEAVAKLVGSQKDWILTCLMRLEAIHAEAWRAYRKSQEDDVTIRTKTGKAPELDDRHEKAKRDRPTDGLDDVTLEPDDAGGWAEVVETRRGQVGDMRCLEVAKGAVADIRKLLGIDAPTRTDLTSGNQPIKAYGGINLDEV